MPQINMPIIGQDLENVNSLKLNAQQTVNFYPDIGEQEARNQKALSPTPGLTSLADTGNGEWRGFIKHSGNLYGVSGNKFYQIDVSDVGDVSFTEIGAISSTSSIISLSANNTQIMICGGGSDDGYIYYVNADMLPEGEDRFQEIVAADFEGAIDAVSVGGYFFSIPRDSSSVFASALQDGTEIDGLDFVTSDFTSDVNIKLAAVNGELWVFGNESVQVYYNSGNPSGFPFSQRTNAVIDFGCAAKNSVTNFNNGIVWLDTRGYITHAQGYQSQVLSHAALNKAIKGYARIDDAVGFSYSDEGHLFYQLTFPSEGITWVYDAFTESWHRRTSVISGVEGRHLGQVYINYNRFDLIGSYVDGTIFKLDRDVATDDGEPILRKRVTQHIHADNKFITICSLELYIDTRNVPLSGQGSEPQVMMRYSKDGGYTWSNELWRNLGANGVYKKRVRWGKLGKSRNWTLEFRFSDPVSPTIIDGFAKVLIEDTYKEIKDGN